MKWLILAFQLFPYILDAVKAIEGAAPLPGQGKEKLALITSIAEVVYDAAGDVVKDLPKGNTISLIIGIVDKTVGVLNKIGVFKTTAAV